jgi:drug/metabolite transporter (DMT)-like permease
LKNPILYFLTVIIWGSTWIAIEYQILEAAIEVSLVYRFALATLVMYGYCKFKGISIAFDFKDHFYIAGLALFNFSLNYYILYESQKYLNSAMASIAFSTMLLLNIINTRLFFKSPITFKVYLGGIMGLFGIVVLFIPSLINEQLGTNLKLGLALALLGTFIASLGNMASVRNSRKGLSVLAVNALGMFYGTCVLLIICLVTGAEFTLPDVQSYWISIVYTAVLGTVVAFACYFELLKEMGPERASYVIVLFPVVAIVISIFVEDFQLSLYNLGGFILIALGNILVITQKPAKF